MYLDHDECAFPEWHAPRMTSRSSQTDRGETSLAKTAGGWVARRVGTNRFPGTELCPHHLTCPHLSVTAKIIDAVLGQPLPLAGGLDQPKVFVCN